MSETKKTAAEIAKETADAKADTKAKTDAKAKSDAKKAKKAKTAKKASKKEDTKPKKVSITVDGKKFTVAPKFRFQGESYKAEDAVKDKELIASLVEANSFVLSKEK